MSLEYPHLHPTTFQRQVHNFIAGGWEAGPETLAIRHKFTLAELGVVHTASPEQVARAIDSARAAMDRGILPGHRRAEILRGAAAWLRDHVDAIGRVIAQESGKEIRQARGEVVRSAHTLELSAEAGRGLAGHVVPMDASPGYENAMAFTVRKPIGLVCAITPFNSPLNLVAHKVGPALAAGNAVVVKPSELTPTPAAFLAHALKVAGLPPGWLHLLHGPGSSVGQRLLEHPAFAMYSFTGSKEVGEHIKRTVGLRKVALELGNNSATIVHRDADLETAARLCARQAFSNSGQVCISVQRIYVHADVRESFTALLERETAKLTVGNPEEEGIEVGPMISLAAARRAEAHVADAVSRGATVLTGGTRRESVFEPTILIDVPEDARVVCEEAFSPIVSILEYRQLADAFQRVNKGEYGLQCGIFTASIETAFQAAHALEMGGIIINGASRYRADVMPYGGIKSSGEGREGPAYAVREMTEERLVVFNLDGSPFDLAGA